MKKISNCHFYFLDIPAEQSQNDNIIPSTNRVFNDAKPSVPSKYITV